MMDETNGVNIIKTIANVINSNWMLLQMYNKFKIKQLSYTMSYLKVLLFEIRYIQFRNVQIKQQG